MPYLLHDLTQHAARNFAHKEALLFKTEVVNYQTLNERIKVTAKGLLALGIKPSERIAIYLPKCIESVVSMFACSVTGACFVPINPVLTAQQVNHILADCSVRILITSSARLKQLEGVLSQCVHLQTVVLVDWIKVDAISLPLINIIQWDDIQSKCIEQPEFSRHDTDVAAILYTSGSRGHPKGVMLSHRNLLLGAKSVAKYLNNTADDRILAVLPLSFDYGLSQLTTAFSVGATVVLMDYLLPRDVIKAIVCYQITGLAAVPPLWIQLAPLDWPEEARQSLRYFTNSGGTLPVEILNALRQKLPNSQAFLMYGLTEAFRSTYVPPEALDSHQASIGIAIPNADVRVLHEDGSECDDNEPGELVHSGELVSLGYWNSPEKTAECFKAIPATASGKPASNWALWSGDTVIRAKDGFLSFVGRKDDMIKTSGYRVSPNEVEELVYHSGLVKEVVALGVAHPMLGQAIVLLVVPENKALENKTLVSYCKKNLPNFMQPACIEINIALARNQNGKIDRKGLSLQYSDLFSELKK
ncbi:acyl-CoA ligase (AMP-forming), exosortase A system-associated [sulfur-oxidizing endosymbiont of Gigantopelta aegis]|uniref:acyl-CoA ligase (AMP-forming), exosortase A system-associated n=1 Tax=sulfur-oxidizing endosymbiont of Gigantopelta aegis TaxID=2794934 RepID=UPI0018DE1351|nr:acyl-CoA ligase (AMP-forming), exosortase A system-associated [sulfur-oxidizing endosymbiont of Gigantopelta aegis]